MIIIFINFIYCFKTILVLTKISIIYDNNIKIINLIVYYKISNGLSIRKNNNVLFLLDLSRNKFDVYHQIMLLKYILYY